ncbi:hypothetical protein [Sorangium sp. So ce887]|uniref:hypothetical protein n=1 Tax=Sorangium sp. So ce887 TaxID=3133324 RepID=UPI003F62E3DE
MGPRSHRPEQRLDARYLARAAARVAEVGHAIVAGADADERRLDGLGPEPDVGAHTAAPSRAPLQGCGSTTEGGPQPGDDRWAAVRRCAKSRST